jgi:hypothetical protein
MQISHNYNNNAVNKKLNRYGSMPLSSLKWLIDSFGHQNKSPSCV